MNHYLKKQEIERLEQLDNTFTIYDEYYNINFKFYYIYQGDSQEAVFINDQFLCYVDIDEDINNIKSRSDELIIIKNHIRSLMEEVDFMYELFEMIKGEDKGE